MEGSLCVDHPGVVVTGTCARCGRFICPVCPQEQGQGRARWCGACAWRGSVHAGALQIGGPLLFIAIGLLLQVGAATIALVRGLSRAALTDPLVFFVATSWAVTVAATLLFFRRRRAAVTAVIVMDLMDLGVLIASRPWRWHFGQSAAITYAMMIFLLVSIPFLLLSSRSKRTFVLPGL